MGKAITIRKRRDTYHIAKRVPVRYAEVEPKAEVWISLKTDCAEIAQQKAARVWNDLINAWDAKLAEDAERAFAAAYNLAQARGFRWLSAEKVATLPRAELLERIEAVTKRERHS